jgi:hypothetical protein
MLDFTRKREQSSSTVVLRYEVTMSSNGSGLVALQFANDPSSSPDWNDSIAVYDQYRVLAMAIEFRPAAMGQATAPTGPALVSVVCDYEDAVALTTHADADDYDSRLVKVCHHAITLTSGNGVWKYDRWRAKGARLMTFTSCDAPTITGSIKLISPSNESSRVYGTIIVSWLTQFTARR